MQTLSDVLNMPIKVCKQIRLVHLGAAMFATAAGLYTKIEDNNMLCHLGLHLNTNPTKQNAAAYQDVMTNTLNLLGTEKSCFHK